MSNPLVSPDGQWWWTGDEWIPAPPSGVQPPVSTPHVGPVTGSAYDHGDSSPGPLVLVECGHCPADSNRWAATDAEQSMEDHIALAHPGMDAPPWVRGVDWEILNEPEVATLDTQLEGIRHVEHPTDGQGMPILRLSEWPLGVCPVCGSGDSCQRISGLVSAGTSHTTALGLTHVGQRGIHVPNEGPWSPSDRVGTLGGGWQETVAVSSTRSLLAARFSMPYDRPTAYSLLPLLFIVALLAGTFLVGLAVPDVLPAWGLGFAIAVATTLIVAGRPARAERFARVAQQAKAWNDAHAMVQASYYCARDDLAFGVGASPDRLGWGPPEDWVRHCCWYVSHGPGSAK